MQNLFQSDVSDKMLHRIDNLQLTSHPLWGKMNVAKMLAHCNVTFEVALGDKQLKRTLMGVLFGGIGKRQILKPEPFKKNLPTDPNFIIKHDPDFNKEKRQLESLVQRFAAADPNVIADRSHPFFGKMTGEEWGWLQYKHLDHHLRQFGV